MAYTEALHKRGTGAQGGQFVSTNSAGQKTMSGNIGYDGKGRGSGYGNKAGDPNVTALQKELNRLGITDSQGKALKVDGKFGPKTTAAVRRLQQRLGLTVDGKVTPALLGKLKKMTPSKHDQHSMHVRHLAAQHKAHAAHTAHEQHAAHQKRTPAPVKKAAPRKRARTGMGTSPKAKAAAQKPSQSQRDAAYRKNSVTRSVGYSRPMTLVERHLPGQHNQQSHANRVGKILAPSKTGLGIKHRVGTHNIHPGDEVEIVKGDQNRMGQHNALFGKKGRHAGWSGETTGGSTDNAIVEFPDGTQRTVSRSNLVVSRQHEALDSEDRKADNARIAALRKQTAQLRKDQAAQAAARKPTPTPRFKVRN